MNDKMDDETLIRYSRQAILPEIGIEGQQKLLDATVLIVGAGGLGSPVAMYLTAAGVGRLMIADDDEVELSNLPRQLLHSEATVGMDKVSSAKSLLNAINSNTVIECIKERMDDERLKDYVAKADVVADTSDNFETRFAVNRVCRQLKTPLVSAAVIRMEGQVSVFTQQDDEGCYQCLYPNSGELDESCARNGVLGPAVGIAGSIQATEVMKLICDTGRSLRGRLLVFDALNMEWREISLSRDPRCEVCGDAKKANK